MWIVTALAIIVFLASLVPFGVITWVGLMGDVPPTDVDLSVMYALGAINLAIMAVSAYVAFGAF